MGRGRRTAAVLWSDLPAAGAWRPADRRCGSRRRLGRGAL